MKILKKIISKALALFGYGIYRIKSKNYSAFSAKDHNSEENVNKLYSNDQLNHKEPGIGRLKFFDIVVAFLNKKKMGIDNKSIIDIGCGTGYFLHTIDNKFSPRELVGIDLSKTAINYAQNRFRKYKFYQFDIYNAFPEQYDAIICLQTLEHLLHPDRALKNIIKIIKLNGFCLITVPNGRIDTFEGHINFWSPESWKVFIENTCKDYSVEVGLLKDTWNYALIKNT